MLADELVFEPHFAGGANTKAVCQLLVFRFVSRVSLAGKEWIVTSAAGDTDSLYRAMDATVKRAENGFQLQLPPAADADSRL